MPVPHHINQLVYPGRAVLALFPILRLHGQLIGQLLMQPQGQFLARHLRCDHPHRQIGDLVIGIEPWSLRQLSRQPVAQRLDTMPLLGGNHKCLYKRIGLVQLLAQP